MKKITTLCRHLHKKVFFVPGIFLTLSLGGVRSGIAQGFADTSARLNSLSPGFVDSVQVINKDGKKTVLAYLKDDRIMESNDSISSLFISRSLDSNELQVFRFAERMPSFPGGESALMKYLHNHTRYPQRARENHIQGRVIVQFVVCADGKLREVKTIGEKIGWDLENEAIRVVKEMPDWIPGKLDGQPVNVMYSLPVRFVLSNKKFSIHYENKGLVKWIGLYLSRRMTY